MNRSNVYNSLPVWTLAIVMVLCVCAGSAYAYISVGQCLPGDPACVSCAAGLGPWQVCERIVYCIRTAIIAATAQMLLGISKYMVPITSALFLVGVMFHGIRIVTGDKELTKSTIIFILKLAIIMTFAFNLMGWGIVPFQMVDSALTISLSGLGSAPGYSPWQQIDIYIGKMIGFGPTIDLSQGLLGIVGAAMFSSTNGILVFIIGTLSMLMILYFAFRAVFSYLAATVVLAFVVIISPLVLPLALFQYTERYFKKWLDLLLAAMLHPVLMFIFLYIFFGVIQAGVDNVFTLLGGNNFRGIWRFNNPAFSWMMPTDPHIWDKFQGQLAGDPEFKPAVPAMQNFMNPLMGGAMDASAYNTSGIDFGGQQIWQMQQLTMGFLSLFIVVYLMRTMLDAIPKIADDITGVLLGLGFEQLPLSQQLKQAFSKVKGAMGGKGGGK